MSRVRQRLLAEDFAFRFRRHLDAPVPVVWQAWTECDRLLRWWGPRGYPVSRGNLDLRVGGRFHYGLQLPDGGLMWGRWDLEHIEPGRRLDFIGMFSNEHGEGPIRHPWEPEWPLRLLTRVEFVSDGAGCCIDLAWIPVDATAPELDRFERGHGECHTGWTGTLDQLDHYLQETEQ